MTSHRNYGIALALVLGTSLSAVATTTAGAQVKASDSVVSSTNAKPRVKKRVRRGFRLRPKRPASKTSHAPLPEPCEIKTSDIIHKKVDIGAQYSLMRKMSGDETSRLEASSILGAVNDGQLAGVFLPPRKPVSDRGKRMSPQRGYWDMIPKGQNSVCLHEPAGEPPMILYREKLPPAQVDAALTKAWKDCNLPGVAQACSYTVDLHKPQFECTKDEDCETRGPGYFCNLDTHTCAIDQIEFPDDFACDAPPLCIPGDLSSALVSCGLADVDACVSRPGKACGVCAGTSKPSKDCHAANQKTHKQNRQRCKDDYSKKKVFKYTAECLKHMAKCAGDPKKNPKACFDAGKCFVAPEPYEQFRKCLDDEGARYERRRQQCHAK